MVAIHSGKSRLSFLLMMLASLFFSIHGFAGEKSATDTPERLLIMAPEYSGVAIPPDKDDVSIDLRFYNKGLSDESVKVWIAEQPEGWKARIKTYRYPVMGVFIKSDDDKSLTFEAEPPEDVKPGDYTFRIKGETIDGRFTFDRNITIRIEDTEKTEKHDKGLDLKVSYPVLRGPSDARFEFLIETENTLDKEAVFDLIPEAPEGWDVLFKPRWKDTYISSLRLKEKGSQSVQVEVKPPAKAEAGEYPIKIRAVSDAAETQVQLTVNLTGTYRLKVGTANGLLSTNARQGRERDVTLKIENTGSAANNDIKFLSFKPENWKVEFEPENIAVLKPGEAKTVKVAVTPYEEALVGDYSVTVHVEGEKASKPIEFRVTVDASTAWGWIGIGIIVFVIAGLTGLFHWLGRR